MYTFTVERPDVTSAWIAACNELDRKSNPHRTAYHTVVRIADPSRDDPAFRAELERVRAHAMRDEFEPIETVANTIFPAALAAASDSHDHLASRYQDMYARVRRFPGNHYDTYFGRLIAYPGPAGGSPIEQLGRVIDRLKQQSASKTPMTAAYEADVAHPASDDLLVSEEAHVHVGGRDNRTRGFPCLSHCSFQLDAGQTVHATAYYRYHYMLDRAYGNYLGLGRLLAYVADRAGLPHGTLTVMAGYARLEGHLTLLRPLLGGTQPMLSV